MGDRGQRKRLLLYGTLIWSIALVGSGLAANYQQLFIAQVIAGIGLGAVGSVGFSLASDFIPPARRGIVLSVWALAQGVGWGTGSAISSTVGPYVWQAPFWLIGLVGLTVIVLYTFSYEPARGQTEPELAEAFASGKGYGYRIQAADLRHILAVRSNRWLILNGFLATFYFGASIWLPRFLAAKVEAEGYTLETGTTVGTMLYFAFQVGVYFAIVGGYWGDRWQKRDLRGRAIIGAIGNLGAVPFTIAFFLLPFTGLDVPEGADIVTLVWASFTSVLTNGYLMAAFFLALVSIILGVIDSPNKAALINDVNLPEHRGTVVGLMVVANGLGLSISNGLAGVAFTRLAEVLPLPWNYSIPLSLFHLFMIPAGLCFIQAIKTTPADILAVRATLAERGQAAIELGMVNDDI